MASPPDAVPIPEQLPRRKSGVVQSSLDLVFSYSRSQQMRYGQDVGSAPSFVHSSSQSHTQSSTSDYGSVRRRRRWSPVDHQRSLSDEEEGVEPDDEEEEAEEEAEAESSDMPRRRSSAMPGVFAYDEPHPEQEEDLEASVSTVKPIQRTLPGGTTSVPGSIKSGQGLGLTLGSSSSSRTSLPTPLTRYRDLQGSGPGSDRKESQRNREDAASAGEAMEEEEEEEARNPHSGVNEQTPLIPASQSQEQGGYSRRQSHSSRRPSAIIGLPQVSGRKASTRCRRKSMVVVEWGESSDGQTLFNAVAVLVGIGLLSLPLAFAYAGWIGGTGMLIGFAALTCHTAKLLARLIRADPSMRGYTDIGKKAFGTWAGGLINVLFCLELFALGVALIVLFGDSLNVLYPSVSANTFKLLGFAIVLPTALLPLHLLSLPSLLSTISSFLLVLIILIDGLYKPTSPGSLRHPEPTSWLPEWEHANWLGGIGLVLAGFGGHAVMPSLARDMKRPEGFDRVINRAFAIATVISLVAGAAGYLMIGQGVSDEITRDLMQPKYAYPRWLNLFALWMIVINPITKFGLCSRPLNLTLETVLGISEGLALVPHGGGASKKASGVQAIRQAAAARQGRNEDDPLLSDSEDPDISKSDLDPLGRAEDGGEAGLSTLEKRKLVARVFSRTVVTAACTAAAIYLPGFGRVMAFLGSFSAFLICIILPLLFYLFLAPRLSIDTDPEISSSSSSARRSTRVIHWILVLLCTVLMIAGTTWAFIPCSGHGELET